MEEDSPPAAFFLGELEASTPSQGICGWFLNLCSDPIPPAVFLGGHNTEESV